METDPIFNFYKGRLELAGDVMSPLYTDAELERFEREAASELEVEPPEGNSDEDHGSR